jgi:hypothetical protein
MRSRGLASVNLLEDNVIPFRLRVDNLTYLVGFMFIASILVLHFFYLIQGRWATSMPMIEEAGTSSPNGMIFSSVFSCISFLVLLGLNSVAAWGEVYGIFPAWFTFSSRIFAFLLPILLMITANFRLDDSILAIWVGLMPFELLSLVFGICFVAVTIREMSFRMRIFRLTILIIAFLSFIFEWSPLGLRWDLNCTKRASGQLIFVSMVVSYNLYAFLRV